MISPGSASVHFSRVLKPSCHEAVAVTQVGETKARLLTVTTGNRIVDLTFDISCLFLISGPPAADLHPGADIDPYAARRLMPADVAL
jgi:hypothetical protein